MHGINALIQEIFISHINAGPKPPSLTEDLNVTAQGNQLMGNADMDTARLSHRVLPSMYGNIQHKFKPLTVKHVYSNEEHFWLGSSDYVSPIDIGCRMYPLSLFLS